LSILKLKMLDEQKIRRTFKILYHNQNKLRKENEELRKKLIELERKIDNMMLVGKN